MRLARLGKGAWACLLVCYMPLARVFSPAFALLPVLARRRRARDLVTTRSKISHSYFAAKRANAAQKSNSSPKSL